MKVRLLILLAIFAVAGFATIFKPAGAADKDEAWLQHQLPLLIPGYAMKQSDSNPLESYRMDAETYKLLQPYGIVARVFSKGGSAIDTVVIAGHSPDNFHDPTWCLPGQGWKLSDPKRALIHTKTRGDVPIEYLSATNRNGQTMLVAYTFHEPAGFQPSIGRLTVAMWKDEFVTGKKQIGAFYRFLSEDPSMTLSDLTTFAGQYLDAANETSHGVF